MPVQIQPKAPAPQPAAAPAPDSPVAEDGAPIVMPNVEAPPVKVDGAAFASEGAEYEVLHTIVGAFDRGAFKAGDKIKASDLGEHIDIDRLLRLEALKPLADAPAKTKK